MIRVVLSLFLLFVWTNELPRSFGSDGTSFFFAVVRGFTFRFYLQRLTSLGSITYAGAQIVPSNIGINYGRLGTNLPSAHTTIETIKSMGVGGVKLYNADPDTLRLLAGTKIQVTIMVPNQEIVEIASNPLSANKWIQDNVLPYYPDTMIRFILVGNEVLSYYSNEDRRVWDYVVPAMRRLRSCLKAHNINNIKLGTPLAMDVFETTFPPSAGTFRSDVSRTMIPELLRFLNCTKSPFFTDVYPYFPWSADPKHISLDFALFQSEEKYTDPGSGLIYTNLLDQMLDSVIFAMSRLGYPDIKLSISETGWPNAGDIDQPGANVYNAATYNRNLVRRMTSQLPRGTPARPEVIIPTFIFALYDEDKKPGPGTERHWGLLHADGTPVYKIDFKGIQGPEHS